MSLTNNSFSAALTRLSKNQIEQAGHRYTRGVDPDAPNLVIEPLFTTLENVACGLGARERFDLVLEELTEAWDRAKNFSQRPTEVQKKLKDAWDFLSPMMDRLRKREESAGRDWSNLLSGLESDLVADMDHWEHEEAKLQPSTSDSQYSSERDTIYGKIDDIGRCLAVVREEISYVKSPAFKVLFDPNLLVTGEWGTGKTHLLCDFTRIRICRSQATILVLAKNFQVDAVTNICSRIESGRSTVEIFDRLEELARATTERAIIILDGVNEGRRPEWRNAVSTIRTLVADRPNVGLIVSCRTPFEHVAIDPADLEKFHEVSHLGFDDQEFDAQAEFFRYYNLPLPEVPLLDREFSRPLTLKLICQSLKDLKGKKLTQGFAGIASGQKGMTYVLESFVKQLGKPIEHEFGLKPKGCWGLLKGNDQIADSGTSGFAPCMAAKSRSYVLRTEADRIIAANYPALRPVKRSKLLDVLRTNGLIEEDLVWYTSKRGPKSRIVYRLPYQRFSDHLIARHLLKKHLKIYSVAAIRKSFTGQSPLARIFRVLSRYHQDYLEPGLAQALITEFPERVANRLPTNQCELFFVLPKRIQDLSLYFGPFVDGLFWRDPVGFTAGTGALINNYLNADPWVWGRMVDALAAVSTKPGHPYHARRLYDFLAKYQMPERDLRWSEYLRQPHSSLTIRRLLTWAEKLDTANVTEQSARELVVLFSLVLTTVVRRDRDLATKALVLIGEKVPKSLFSHVMTSLDFNDPYVPERMLAAAYGTTLSLVDSERAPTFRPLLGQLANDLYLKMFGPRATNTTLHTLMRDYALGIIEIALSVNCVVLPKNANQNLTVPFPNTLSTFTSDGTPDQTIRDAIGHAIQMDFGNYTIGRLIRDRGNYDFKNLDYVQVRAKIERRIFELGYREEMFKDVDAQIGRVSWNARDHEKVDRYGKKYSWIAYFEMWGEREVNGMLSDWHTGERTSDCGIDPSFPIRPPHWIPPKPELFGNLNVSTEEWVQGEFTPNWQPLLMVPEINGNQGEWVLLNGYVYGADEGHDRDLFAFLRGVFIRRKDLCCLRTKFLKVDHPGNRQVPEGATETYLYAGEAGRRQNFTRHLNQKNNLYHRQILTAFDRYEHVCGKETTPSEAVTIEFKTREAKQANRVAFDLLGPKQEMRHVPGIRIEIPYIHFGWESYHSPYNDFLGFDLPALSLIKRLSLSTKNREIDFYDSNGNLGTLYREAGEGFKDDQHRLLYARADLLQRYLTDTRQVLVWCNWGERDWLTKSAGYEMISNSTRQRIYLVHGNIHRSFFQWSARDRKIV